MISSYRRVRVDSEIEAEHMCVNFLLSSHYYHLLQFSKQGGHKNEAQSGDR